MSKNSNTDFTLGSCPFEFLKLSENVDLDKCKFSAYGKAFGSRSEFSFAEEAWEKMSLFLKLI